MPCRAFCAFTKVIAQLFKYYFKTKILLRRIKTFLGFVDLAMPKSPLLCFAVFAYFVKAVLGLLIVGASETRSGVCCLLVVFAGWLSGWLYPGWQYRCEITAHLKCTLCVSSSHFLVKNSIFVPGDCTRELTISTQRADVDVVTQQCSLCFLFLLFVKLLLKLSFEFFCSFSHLVKFPLSSYF